MRRGGRAREASADGPATAAAARGPPTPNVLLVVLDSVRAANASAYGHANETTPFLSAFASRATLYEQARAPGSWSLPSHASIFTGLHVAEHRITEPSHRLEPGHAIFESLREEGYATAAFSENPWLATMDVGLDAGFDAVCGPLNVPFPEAANPTEFTAAEGQGRYLAFLRRCLEDGRPARSVANGVATKLAWDHPRLVPGSLTASAPASAYVDRFLDWHAERRGPWAACVNLMDAHAPYEPAEEHDRWGGKRLRKLQNGLEKHVWSFHGGLAPWWQCRALEALYDGAIRGMDAQLRRLVGALKRRGDLDDTLLVITSDHGEGFGEVSRLKGIRIAGHVDGIHEALLHVPLVVKLPGQTEGERVREPASLTRFPAVVRAALDGRSETGGFAAGPIVASAHGLTAPNAALARRYCDPDDRRQFRGELRAVYEAESGSGSGAGSDAKGNAGGGDRGSALKYATWEREGEPTAAATVRSVDARTSYVRAREDGGRVADAFDDFADARVRASGAGVEGVDEATRRRLRDLGYAE
ncbi:sulfatase [Halegenticoccus tardaugens]|uniref:sulfatase n=1 Tax=Halegenticoccus tardaugens TaxID=2071624 RepID=UPI00100B6187|nr:sulfatase [Halegenticoccus tardaugens]